jgi:cation diffusion facilitator CzcD-associated flavoprotein CzcO
VSLQQHWQEVGGIEAYKTIAVNGCPNFFYILGPNSGSGHTSVLFASEWYVTMLKAEFIGKTS